MVSDAFFAQLEEGVCRHTFNTVTRKISPCCLKASGLADLLTEGLGLGLRLVFVEVRLWDLSRPARDMRTMVTQKGSDSGAESRQIGRQSRDDGDGGSSPSLQLLLLVVQWYISWWYQSRAGEMA